MLVDVQVYLAVTRVQISIERFRLFNIQAIMKKYFLPLLAIMLITLNFSLISCGSDDDNGNNDAIAEYVGSWSCTSPATYITSTVVEEGTKLLISSSGSMTWTMSDGSQYSATMRALGDDWADIIYNGKTYRAEIYTSGDYLHINVNGNSSLKVKDFPFDGSYKRVG